MTDPIDTVVIGGGQAGLAVGYHLRRLGRRFVVLDRDNEIGASWRRRWDSLRLFTPAGFSHLPGMAFPAAPDESPTKDAMADYLAAYASRFALPVELCTTVVAVDRADTDVLVTASDGRVWRARNVVVATSAHGRANVPGFAADLDPSVVQLHSSTYQRPGQIPTGPVLVVGAGNSGAEIAVDLASAEREVWLAGRDVGHVPLLGTWTYPLMRLLGRPGSTLAQRGLRGGAEPLGRIRPGDLEAAGVRRVPRVVGTRDGSPLLDDDRTVPASTVVWCTGFRADHGFVRLPVCDAQGRLIHRRGVTGSPGLYVVGMPHQSSITSHLVGGVGTDARYVVEHLAHRPATTAPPVTVYTRAGCGYCHRLRVGLRRRGVSFTEVDIWRTPDAAAAIRAAAGGTETVPTVEIGGRWLVNPTARDVSTLAACVTGSRGCASYIRTATSTPGAAVSAATAQMAAGMPNASASSPAARAPTATRHRAIAGRPRPIGPATRDGRGRRSPPIAPENHRGPAPSTTAAIAQVSNDPPAATSASVSPSRSRRHCRPSASR